MDKVCFTPEQPAGYWNADQLAEELKYAFHSCKLSGKVTLTFERPFCKIKQITLNVHKEITPRGYKTNISLIDVMYQQDGQQDKRNKRADLKLIKTLKAG